MSIKKIDEAALRSWVDALIGKQQVIGVRAEGERFAFAPLASGAELRLDYDVTKLPPKKLFQPQSETLLTFDKSGYKQVLESAPFVLFGVHPYDLAAILQMDAVFAKDNRDSHYWARRENATIVASDVQNASANVFAACMNTAVLREGYDVLLTKVGDSYVVEAATDRGEALLAAMPAAADADAAALARREQVWEDNQRLLKKHVLNCQPSELPGLLADGSSYDHEVWAKKAELCYSCGSCVLVCPTCYCFDVSDEVNWDLESGERKRRWDGCLLQEFALVAGDHNFRKNRYERYRHRFYRKGKYLWDRMGHIACVGCGRCITACTTKIANPVELYNTLLEDR